MTDLSDRERRVLYGLVRYPQANDRALSGYLNIKHSTVSAIRRRLHARGMFETKRIPNLQALGGELAYFMVGNVPGGGGAKFRNAFSAALGSGFPRIVCSGTSGESSYILGFARDYTEAMLDMHAWDRILADGDGQARDWTRVVLPLSISPMLLNFNYSPLLNRFWGMGDTSIAFDAEFRGDRVHLTKKECRVFHALITDPEAPDHRIADAAGVSRQAVNSMKTRFRQHDLFVERRIPDLKALGLELLVLRVLRYHPRAPMVKRRKILASFLGEVSLSFVIGNDTESVVIGAAQDYTTFLRERESPVSRSYRGFLRSPPEVHLLPLADLHSPRDHRYGELVLSLLGGGLD